MMKAPMVYPLPFGLVVAIHKAKDHLTVADIEDAKAALELTNGNVPQAAGLLRDTMSLAKAVAAVQTARGK